MKIKKTVEVELDLTEYDLLPVTGLKELKEHIDELYKEIWLEACYDPTNEEYRRFATKLLPNANAIKKYVTDISFVRGGRE